MKDEFITLNHVQSHLITFGDPFDCDGKDVIIIITGNPGITDFYTDYASELHNATGLPLCIIGHAGHEVVPDKQSNVLKDQEHLFQLNGQLKHKLELINNYIDNRSKIHLVGHSIGAWLILELLQNNENLALRLKSINLLFPTLQRMAESRNGRFLNNFVRNIHNVILFLLILVNLLPASIMDVLVKLYLKLCSLPLHYSKHVITILNPKVGEKVLYLAYDEMDTVKNLNIDVVNKNKHLINIIYSDRDNWVPVSYIEDLHKLQPDIPMKEVRIDHAFVLKSSEIVAEITTQFINTKL